MNHPITTTADRVRKVIATVLGRDPEAIAHGVTLYDLEADDLEVVEILMECEVEFGIEISDDAITGETTVAQIVAVVSPKAEAAA